MLCLFVKVCVCVCEFVCVSVCVHERESVCVCEREREGKRERDCVRVLKYTRLRVYTYNYPTFDSCYIHTDP